jgi:hypothetical protein
MLLNHNTTFYLSLGIMRPYNLERELRKRLSWPKLLALCISLVIRSS